jgi:hypothetical protein
MGERDVSKIDLGSTKVSSISCLSEMKARQSARIAEIRDALVAAGFDTLSKQAAALRLSKSTAWAVLQADHKSSGLSASVINRMYRSQELSPTARRVIDEYVHEKLQGVYGHTTTALKRFRAQLGYPVHPLAIRGRECK